MEECGDEATAFQPGQRVVCVPSQAWSALDGSGTWQQVSWHTSCLNHVRGLQLAMHIHCCPGFQRSLLKSQCCADDGRT